MVDNLQKYWTKRNFGITAEPKGTVGRSGAALTFVIQKHAARSLHYDFRLELDGTLKSWAVPKGPSLDPADKRMAVHVEDHPLDYATFEGVIPAGQYGAGTVIVWDRGTWVPTDDPGEGYRQGKLKFELHGEKLQGRWTLVRMRGRGKERQEPWLLIKERDDTARSAAEFDITEAMPDSVNVATSFAKSAKKTEKTKQRAAPKTALGSAPAGLPAGARAAKLPLSLSPQLATLAASAPKTGDWIYEIKFDGYRIVTRVDGDDIRLFTRNGHNWTSKLKHLAQAIATLGLPDGWLDGEIVIPAGGGRTNFQSLQNAFDTSSTQDIRYYLFDLPYFAGHDLRGVPLRERRSLLRQVMSANRSGYLQFSEEFEADAGSLLDAACRLQLEGVIGKRADAPYTSTRSTTWIKLKCTRRQEFVIGGYTDPRGTRTGLGSLLLGVHDTQGRLMYAGNVGTGFDEGTLTQLKIQLSALHTTKAPFDPLPAGVKGHWVKPKLVAEVSFGEWTNEGRIRHSVFHALRTDKAPGTVKREEPVSPIEVDVKKKSRDTVSKSAAGKTTSSGTASKKAAVTSVGIKISHGERVIDESTGLTKLDLVRYYESVADAMLPHLKGRPTSLVRGPSGIGGQLFFQKHVDTLRIPGVNELDPAFLPGHPPMFEIATPQALVHAAQLNAIEFHTWNATVKSIENPDRMLFDLDPGDGVSWQQVVEGTMLTKAFLDELNLKSFLKTSGGKGLHVVVPLSAVSSWDEVKDFSEAVVVHLARTIPQRFVAKSGPKNRVGKIFIDYLRNGRGATTAAAFSARSRPGLGVSMPLAWDELEALKSASQWTITNALSRIQKQRSDPWETYRRTRQTIKRAAQSLAQAGK